MLNHGKNIKSHEEMHIMIFPHFLTTEISNAYLHNALMKNTVKNLDFLLQSNENLHR